MEYKPKYNVFNDENFHPNVADTAAHGVYKSESKQNKGDIRLLNTPHVENVDQDSPGQETTPLSQLPTLSTTNQKATIIISPKTIQKEIKK